jgi:hypothetical protein
MRSVLLRGDTATGDQMKSRASTIKTFTSELHDVSASQISILRRHSETANSEAVMAQHIKTKFNRAIDGNLLQSEKNT